MATAIIPRVVRGVLWFEVSGIVLLPTLSAAIAVWSAAEAHRLDLVEVRP